MPSLRRTSLMVLLAELTFASGARKQEAVWCVGPLYRFLLRRCSFLRARVLQAWRRGRHWRARSRHFRSRLMKSISRPACRLIQSTRRALPWASATRHMLQQRVCVRSGVSSSSARVLLTLTWPGRRCSLLSPRSVQRPPIVPHCCGGLGRVRSRGPSHLQQRSGHRHARSRGKR